MESSLPLSSLLCVVLPAWLDTPVGGWEGGEISYVAEIPGKRESLSTCTSQGGKVKKGTS